MAESEESAAKGDTSNREDSSVYDSWVEETPSKRDVCGAMLRLGLECWSDAMAEGNSCSVKKWER